jgi:MFS family permease
MAAYGITASIFSIIIGYVARLTHSRTVCMILSSFLSYAIFVVMLVWNPNGNQVYVLYILACLSGLTTAIIKPFTTGSIKQ